MRLGLCVVALVLSWTHLAMGSRGIKGKRQRRISAEGSQACAKGCELCSEVNGCLKCSPKLFILLERNDIRQVGVCLPSCPPGYFDARNPDMNKCIKCKIEHCEACFSHNFCTKCQGGLYLHKGRCYPACPEGSTAANSTMECGSPAQCEMSEWSPWGPCSKKRKLCGFRKGSEERTRRVLHAPGGDHTTCSDTKETRKCTVRRTPCPEGQKRRKGGQGRRENANRHPARKNSKEPGSHSETQRAAAAATARDSRATHISRTHLGTTAHLQIHVEDDPDPVLYCITRTFQYWSVSDSKSTHTPPTYPSIHPSIHAHSCTHMAI